MKSVDQVFQGWHSQQHRGRLPARNIPAVFLRRRLLTANPFPVNLFFTVPMI
jgi:hypothetical protein